MPRSCPVWLSQPSRIGRIRSNIWMRRRIRPEAIGRDWVYVMDDGGEAQGFCQFRRCPEPELVWPEKRMEEQLLRSMPDVKWSCKNQARMHLRNREQPYLDIADAMKRWPETATAVGIRLNERDEPEVIAPHGLQDLLALVLRRSPYCRDPDMAIKRIRAKGWLRRWPKLRMVEHSTDGLVLPGADGHG